MSYEEGPANPWIPPSGRPVTQDWTIGDGGQLVAGLALDVVPWLLLAGSAGLGGPRWLIAVGAVLSVVAAVSLAIGAVTKRSLTMRLTGWPAGSAQPRIEYGAAWIELFVLIIIVLCSRALYWFGVEATVALAVTACVVAAVSAVLLLTTGRSIGRRLLRVVEEL